MAKASPDAEAQQRMETQAAVAKALDDPGRQPPGETVSPVAKVARSVARQLAPQDVQPAGSKWNSWTAMAHAEHTIEDVMHPRYLWARHEQMNAGDYVEIKHIHGKFVVCLDVIAINKVARGIVANVRHVFDYTQAGAIQIKPSLINARIEFLGARQWAVVEGTHVAADQFADRGSAEKWLDEQRFKAA